MINEPGADYKPHPTASRKPTKPPPPPQPQPDPADTERRTITDRPLWVRVAIYLTMLLGIMRIMNTCASTVSDPTPLLVQIASGVVLILIGIGLLGMRRWGAYLFIFFCFWSVISTLLVGGYRILIMDEVITDQANLAPMIMGQLMEMGMAAVFYGVLGAWFMFNRQVFLPGQRGWDWRGNASALVMVGLLMLYSVTLIASARNDLKFQETQMAESQTCMTNLFGFLN